jgi:hypothetical protein
MNFNTMWYLQQTLFLKCFYVYMKRRSYSRLVLFLLWHPCAYITTLVSFYRKWIRDWCLMSLHFSLLSPVHFPNCPVQSASKLLFKLIRGILANNLKERARERLCCLRIQRPTDGSHSLHQVAYPCFYVSSFESYNVLFPLLGENEIMHFPDSPYWVTLSPHTFIGILYLQVLYFGIYFILSHISPAVDSLT